MTTPFYIIITICCCLLLGLAYTQKVLARADEKKSQQIKYSALAVVRLERFLNLIPESYLSVTVKKLIYQDLLKHLDLLQKEQPDNASYQQKNTLFQQHLEHCQHQDEPASITEINNTAEAKAINERLHLLAQFIAAAQKAKKIPLASAREELAEIKRLHTETTAAAHISQADAAMSQGNERIAVHQLNRALQLFSKSQLPAHQQHIEDIKAKIAQAKQHAAKQNKQAETHSDSALSQGIENMLEDENNQLKRHF